MSCRFSPGTRDNNLMHIATRVKGKRLCRLSDIIDICQAMADLSDAFDLFSLFKIFEYRLFFRILEIL